MISEIDLQDWIVCPAEPLHNIEDKDKFLWENKVCSIKATDWFTFLIVDNDGKEYNIDFYTMVNPIKKKD